ncbi:MAG TPA: helix-turn-helix transcriptional regulator [Gemmataceae bacterium]|nr:helix-turn-helix transcriptional regulator [Gemmataceae bacterium]
MNVQKWLEALDKQRRALKMSLPVLAERAKLSRATVCRILKEKRTSSSLESVLAIANVLGGEVELHMEDPEKLVERQIQKRAKKIVRMVQGTMALEGQGITDPDHIDQLVEMAAKEIRAKPRKQLWVRQCRSSNPSQAKHPSPMSPN